MLPEIKLTNTDSIGALTLRQQAMEYLKIASNLLKKNKNIDVSILRCEAGISSIDETKTLVYILYSADGNEVNLFLAEKVFKDESMKTDASIGIRPDMALRAKALLRVAHILYAHRKDY